MSKLISEKIIHENIHFMTIMRPQLADEGLTFLTDDENFIQVGLWRYQKEKFFKHIITIHLIVSQQKPMSQFM